MNEIYLTPIDSMNKGSNKGLKVFQMELGEKLVHYCRIKFGDVWNDDAFESQK